MKGPLNILSECSITSTLVNKSKEKNIVIWTEKYVLHVAGEMFLGSSVLYSCKWSLRFCCLSVAGMEKCDSHVYYFPKQLCQILVISL